MFHRDQKLLQDFYQILRKSSYLYEEIFSDLKGGRERFNIQSNLKQKYKNYNLDEIFKNHELSKEYNLQSIIKKPLETLLYEEIEEIWNYIDKKDDWSLFNNKMNSINTLKKENLNHGLG